MIKHVSGNKFAVIVLHEIYGLNSFIVDVCQQYHAEGYDVFCPNLLKTEKAFSYLDEGEAYHSFFDTVGFDAFKKVNLFATDLKITYSKVFIIGFSVGATIAWRCSEAAVYDGAICCYGSRIRDYVTVQPKCPALLVFARYDSFDVEAIREQLQNRENIIIEILEASHGFIDAFSKSYNRSKGKKFDQRRKSFLADCSKEK